MERPPTVKLYLPAVTPPCRSDSILGLWVGEITVGSTGAAGHSESLSQPTMWKRRCCVQEHFQVIADNDDEKAGR